VDICARSVYDTYEWLCMLPSACYLCPATTFGAKRALAVRENPTSSPLIAPVNTITPEPLLYHVCTFYIVRYNSLTTHPSQPICTLIELQKRNKKEKQRRINKKKPPTKHKQKQTIYIIRKSGDKVTSSRSSNPNIQFTSLPWSNEKVVSSNPKKTRKQDHSNNNHFTSSIHYQHTNTSPQNKQTNTESIKQKHKIYIISLAQ